MPSSGRQNKYNRLINADDGHQVCYIGMRASRRRWPFHPA